MGDATFSVHARGPGRTAAWRTVGSRGGLGRTAGWRERGGDAARQTRRPRAKRGPASCGPTPVIVFLADGRPLWSLALTGDDRGRTREVELILLGFPRQPGVGLYSNVGNHVFACRAIRLDHPELRASELFDTTVVL